MVSAIARRPRRAVAIVSLRRFLTWSPEFSMSEQSDNRSAEFLKICEQFQLGALTTESSHPLTAKLSDVAKDNVAAGLGLLFDVDDDVVRTYRDFAKSGRAQIIQKQLLACLRNGGGVFFSSCCSTGRVRNLNFFIFGGFFRKKSARRLW